MDPAQLLKVISSGNLAYADMALRKILQINPDSFVAWNFLGFVAMKIQRYELAAEYFQSAVDTLNRQIEAGRLPETPRSDVESFMTNVADNLRAAKNMKHVSVPVSLTEGRFLLIKAWGTGFWSEVDHVLGQLLLAEITSRIPVIHWGSNNLFNDHPDRDAFQDFFEPLNDYTIDDLNDVTELFFPPKWNRDNLNREDINKFHGVNSGMSAIYFLGRQEKVAVADFHTAIVSIIPWIPEGHFLHGCSVKAAYQYLIKRYLHPRRTIMDRVDALYQRDFVGHEVVAVHVRGTDKIQEEVLLSDAHREYPQSIAGICRRFRNPKIFLMTDSTEILREYIEKFDNRLIYTACTRSSDDRGVHVQGRLNRYLLGEEIMIDSYLAVRCQAFIGLVSSNVSCMIRDMVDWPVDRCHLIGSGDIRTEPNFFGLISQDECIGGEGLSFTEIK